MHRFSKWTFAGILGMIPLAAAADWPQYRGPNGDGKSTEKLLAPWPAGGPKVLWKIPVGNGMGSFAIKDGRAYYLAANGNSEACHAIDMSSGKEIWSRPIGATQSRSSGQGGAGPASTPVAVGDKVYVYGSKLRLVCLNSADGSILWQHDVEKEFNGQTDQRAISSWGSAASPIVEDDLVIVQGGGAGQHYLAFNKDTGQLAWKSETEILTQSTPAAATIAGVRQVIFLQQSGLVSIDPKTGKTLWKQPYASATAIAPSPAVSDDMIYVSIGYSVGGGAFKVSKNGETWNIQQVWRTPRLNMNWWSTAVIKDGYIYSIHGRGDDRNAPLQCVDLQTGEVKWSGPPAGGGEILVVDDKLIVQAGGTGTLHLVQPDPTGYKEISKAQPLDGRAWGWPAFSKGVFVYRTNTEAIALDMSPK
jgi:outer membrane protein assembly factor BamB